MVKRNLFNGLTLLITSFFIFLSSCSKDDPVTPPPPVDSTYDFDSARYSWKIDTLDGYFSPVSLSCLDTNDIYFLDIYRTLVNYNGSEFRTWILPFSSIGVCVKAFHDKIYIGGSYIGTERPCLLEKKGEVFEQIEIPDSNQQYFIISMERTNEDVLWLGANMGKLMKYESGSFEYFQFDPKYFVNVFEDKNKDIFAVNSAEIFDSLGFNGRKYIEIHKYVNNQFELLYSKFFPEIDNYTLSTVIMDKEIYAVNQTGMYNFTGYDFVKAIDLPAVGFSNRFSGSGNNDILIEGRFYNKNYFSTLVHWNGYRWSKEIELSLSGIPGYSEKVSDSYVFVGGQDLRRTFIVKSITR